MEIWIYKVYRDKNLLYVGEGDLFSRLREHAEKSSWFHKANLICAAILPNKEIAVMYETYLINTLNPIENKQKNNHSDMSLVRFKEGKIKWHSCTLTEEAYFIEKMFNPYYMEEYFSRVLKK